MIRHNSPVQSFEEQEHQRTLEFHKTVHDYFKHMATLSTGSILLIVTFLEKLSKQPRWTWLVAAAICAFAVCVVSTIVAQVGNMEMLKQEEGDESWLTLNLTGYGMLVTWISFIAGVLSLVVFGVVNAL